MNAHCVVRFAAMFQTKAFSVGYGSESREARADQPAVDVQGTVDIWTQHAAR